MFEQMQLFAEEKAFTNFALVNPQTDISRLNLNWQETDLPERERTKHVHRLHPYLGKYVPQLVEIFLRKYARERVVDPFCGSGTTLVEASVLGLNGYGADISEFNCLLSQVKTTSYAVDRLELVLTDAYCAAEAMLETNSSEVEFVSKYLTNWYSEKSIKDLLAYRNQIGRFDFAEVMKIILARSARSARLAAHYDLDFPEKPMTQPYYCRKHKRICVPTEQALHFLRRYTLDTVKRIKAYSALRKENSIITVECGDSRQIEFPECDMVMTSPPYVGLIDYHEQHRYAYELLNISDRSQEEIGPASKGKNKAARKAYVEDMLAVFENVCKKVIPGGTIVVVVHDKYKLYPGISEKLGLKTTAVLERQVNRRTGRRAGNFYENIYIWEKE